MAALHTGGCAGWSLSIYNPDLDPDHGAARNIVELVARIAPSAARQHPPLRQEADAAPSRRLRPAVLISPYPQRPTDASTVALVRPFGSPFTARN
jgi:hypothetical protein